MNEGSSPSLLNWQVCEVVQQFSISGDGTVGDHVQL